MRSPYWFIYGAMLLSLLWQKHHTIFLLSSTVPLRGGGGQAVACVSPVCILPRQRTDLWKSAWRSSSQWAKWSRGASPGEHKQRCCVSHKSPLPLKLPARFFPVQIPQPLNFPGSCSENSGKKPHPDPPNPLPSSSLPLLPSPAPSTPTAHQHSGYQRSAAWLLK